MKTENIPYKIYLSESEMPQNWYNVRADMKNKPAPLVNPGTGKPMGFDDLRPVFCDELIERGDYSPSVTLALTIAKVCGVTVEEVFYLQEETENEK